MRLPRAISCVLSVALSATLFAGAVAAQSPAPLPDTPGTRAMALVRATDARFADIPTIEEAQRVMASTFDWAPILAGSWIRVPETSGTLSDEMPGVPAWLDPDLGRLVEVQLVDGCPESIKELPETDPCAYRHTWLYFVAPDQTLTLIADAGSPDPS